MIILGIADKPGSTSFAAVIHIFAQEVLGGIIIGLILGYLGYQLIKTIHDFQTIFLISIALDIWKGEDANVEEAQKLLYRRSKLDAAARLGEYNAVQE